MRNAAHTNAKNAAKTPVLLKKRAVFHFFIDGEYDRIHIMGRILFRVRLGNYIKKFEGKACNKAEFQRRKAIL